MTRLLNRMVDDKLIRVHKVGQNDPLYFFLPTTKAPTVFSHAHERACADVYTAYETAGKLPVWNVPENFEDYESYVTAGVRPDRISIIDGKIVFWEIDKGTESYQGVSDKVNHYLNLWKQQGYKTFHVVFATKDYFRYRNGSKILRQSAKTRARGILLDLIPFKRSNQFIVGQLDRIITDPFGAVFASPSTPDKLISLADLDVKPDPPKFPA
jgi:hypothetical protein